MLRSAPLLAWRLLVHDKPRLLASAAGIAFAVLLVLLQMGFRNGLLDSSLRLLEILDGDVFVIEKSKRPFLAHENLRRERLYQALSVRGVARAYPLWMDIFFWKNRATGSELPIRVIALVPGDPVFMMADVNAKAAALRRADTALVDERSRSSFGDIGLGAAQVERRWIEVVGTFDLGTDFQADGNLIVSDDTFFRLYGGYKEALEMAILKLEPGADVATVVGGLREVLPRDAAVFSKDELRLRDWQYWETGTPISVMVLIGMVMGILVGIGICYQILYIDITDHLAEFATVKAVGYSNLFLVAVVLVEALLLSLFGFFPGLVIGGGLYRLLAWVTGLVMNLTLARAGTVLLITLGMCTLAASLAVVRVLQADPAELF